MSEDAAALQAPPSGPRTRAGKAALRKLEQLLPERCRPFLTAAFSLTRSGVVIGALFGLSVLVRCCITFCGEVDWRGIASNHFSAPSPAGVLITAVATLLAMSLASNLARITRWASSRLNVLDATDRWKGLFKPCSTPHRLRGHAVFWGVLAALLVVWMPVLLSYAPGSVPNDAAWSIAMAMGTMPLNSHHPLFYTAIVKVCFELALALGGGYQEGVLVYSILQSVVLAGSIAYLVSWMARRRLPRIAVVATFLYFVLCPLFSGYAIIMWKDPMFGAFALLLTLLLIDTVLQNGAVLRTFKGVAACFILSVLLILIRSNGVLLVVGSAFMLFIFMRREVRAGLVGGTLAALMVFAAMQWVVPRAMNVETEYVEGVGVQLQQVAYVVVTEGGVPAEYQGLVNGILPANLWRQAYSPCCVDSLKWNDSFNKDYLSDHRDEFMRMWRELGLRHPVAYLQAYALNTFGYWTPGSSNYKEMLTLTMSTDEDAMPYALYAHDLVQQATGVSLRPVYEALIGPRGSHCYFSGGTLSWIVLFTVAALLLIKRPRWLIPLSPAFFGWLSVMIASPAAFGLRYLFVSIICLPLILMLPAMALRRGDERGLERLLARRRRRSGD